MRNKKVAIHTLIILFLFVGCNAFDPSLATINYACPAGKEGHFSLGLWKKTNKLMFAHGVPGFMIQTYNFTLVKKPEAHTVYNTTDLILNDENDLKEHISQLTSGQIVVDLRTKRVSVSLMTQNGPFHGNGEYALNYIE